MWFPSVCRGFPAGAPLSWCGQKALTYCSYRKCQIVCKVGLARGLGCDATTGPTFFSCYHEEAIAGFSLLLVLVWGQQWLDLDSSYSTQMSTMMCLTFKSYCKGIAPLSRGVLGLINSLWAKHAFLPHWKCCCGGCEMVHGRLFSQPDWVSFIQIERGDGMVNI